MASSHSAAQRQSSPASSSPEAEQRRRRQRRRTDRSRSRDDDRGRRRVREGEGEGSPPQRRRQGSGDKASRRRRSRSRDTADDDDEERRRQCRPRHREQEEHRGGSRGKGGEPCESGALAEHHRHRDRVPAGEIKAEEVNPASETAPEEEEDKEGPNFEVSGKLLEDTNVFNGVVVKYSEPPEARKTKKRWRFYVFKGEESLPVLHLHRQSAYLIGKDRKVCDLPVDHPSCSRQHAVLQYRQVDGGKVRPYIIDLKSSNGTYLNNQRIEPSRYVELREKDVLKFGYSSREYVLLHDQSQD